MQLDLLLNQMSVRLHYLWMNLACNKSKVTLMKHPTCLPGQE